MNIIKVRIESSKRALQDLYAAEGKERVGFMLPGSGMVEVQNVADKPEEGFLISPEDILKYTEEKEAWATWHTHPNETSNLSGEDFLMIKAWPDLIHFIVGKDGVKSYQFNAEKKAVLEV